MSIDVISISSFVTVPVPGDEESKISIKKFVETKKLEFTKGLGFYQLSKPEIIQLNKEILVQRISDPKTLITGDTVRKVLKINEATRKKGKFMVDDELLKEFKVFVQSTSYNRNLMGGTTFLYKKEGAAAVTIAASVPEDKAVSGSKRPKRAKSPVNATHKRSRTAPITSTASSPAPVVPRPVSGETKVEIVFSFDTTGSMYPCLSTVRSVIRDTLKTLTTKIPSIRIGILAHGDYCDADSAYVTKAANNFKLCSSSQLSLLVDFVTETRSTFGGDFPECYELVLRQTRTKFDWTENANKSLVMIGDATPHEPIDNPEKINWRVEAEELKKAGIRVYAVQALHHAQSDEFYRKVANLTLGFHLRLHQFSSITDFLTAVCYHEGDNASLSQGLVNSSLLEQFETEVSSSGRMVNNLRQLFDLLNGRTSAADDHGASASGVTTFTGGRATGLIPVSPSRFQVLTVDEDKQIKVFAEERGLIFKVGRGFYEFTKPESISDKKEVVLMDKTTGDFYTGWEAAREFAGIDPGLSKKQSPKESDKYVVFVQSSSYNRKLIAGQRFLYEVDSDR